MKALLLFCLLPFACLAQSPLITGSGIDWTKPPSSPQSIPQSIPGLAYWWVATDSLATNAAVTNWFDRVQNVLQTNGNSGLRPQNSTAGIVYPNSSGFVGLTNPAITLGQNWSVVVFIKKLATGYESTIQALLGKKDGTFDLGFGSGAGSTVLMDYFVASTHNTISGHNLPLNIEYDIVYMNSNGTSPKFLAYTNAVGIGQAGGNASSQTVDCFGANAAFASSDFTAADVREYIIYTNIISLTSISNLHYYRTNTYGAP